MMNEKSLLFLCYLITTICILPFAKRLPKRWLAVSILFIPIAIYGLLLILFVGIALIFGDK